MRGNRLVQVVVPEPEAERHSPHRPGILRVQAEIPLHVRWTREGRVHHDDRIRRTVDECQLADVAALQVALCDQVALYQIHPALERMRTGHIRHRRVARVQVGPAVIEGERRWGVPASAGARIEFRDSKRRHLVPQEVAVVGIDVGFANQCFQQQSVGQR